ncbi:predicted protein [Arabidopsis lyrata subsp. lyrata]|uniref:Predicted protein n=1 Tax=Arabidopsis lyrata subsp. lyrata TaxID=81972 RepID=D7LXL7_ARALL|nr:predicted protein [Arabidopsis lyrata subsp. lyrata]
MPQVGEVPGSSVKEWSDSKSQLLAEEVFFFQRRHKSSSMGVHPESGSSNVPVVERDPMKLWKEMKQNGWGGSKRNLDAVNTDASRSDSYPRIFKYSMPDCNYSMHYYDENNRVCSDGGRLLLRKCQFLVEEDASDLYSASLLTVKAATIASQWLELQDIKGRVSDGWLCLTNSNTILLQEESQLNSVGTADEFFLAANLESSGSPPKRSPPFLTLSHCNKSRVILRTMMILRKLVISGSQGELPMMRLILCQSCPSFATGITDDDLCETAFEILLGGAGASGSHSTIKREKKKEKSRSRLKRKLGRKSESVSQSRSSSGLVALLEMMRGRMEISEAMDIRTRQGLLDALAGKVGKRMDSLLSNMLAERLINNPVVGCGESGRRATDLKSLLLRIEGSVTSDTESVGSVSEFIRIGCQNIIEYMFLKNLAA